jgi:ABC-type multidrug transport system, ATPase and permease components
MRGIAALAKQNNGIYFIKLIKLCWNKQRKYMIAMSIASIPKVFLPFVTLLALQSILNIAQKNMYTDVVIYIVIYFASLLFSKILETAFDYLQGIFKVKINYDINCLIIDKSQIMELSDYEDSDTYDRLQRALNETQSIYQSISSMFIMFNNLITVVGSLLIIILWKWYVVGILIVVPIISFYFTVMIGKYEFNVMQERISGIRKINYLRNLINDVHSYKENKVLKSDQYLYSKFKALFEQFIKKDREILGYKSINAIIFNTLETIIGVGVIATVIYSLTLRKILIGTANTYIQCIWNVIKSTDQTINNLATIYTKSQYLKNLFEFIEDGYGRCDDVCHSETIDIEEIESIQFINVNFRYREELPYVLRDINLKISKDERIVIVGDSGSGKSTFIKLLSNLYSDYEGEILVNGVSLKKINKESLYDKIGIVYQDFVKYEFTLRENLLLGNFDLTEAEININVGNIINKGILSFGEKLQHDLDTQLGTQFDKGVQLSGGEWQQVAFARAIMKKSDMLILDEPSSGLDVISEGNMYAILNEVTNSTLSLLVTHRLYIADKFAQRALVFKEGKIIEDNTIEKLMSYDSYYKFMLSKTNINEEITKVEV